MDFAKSFLINIAFNIDSNKSLNLVDKNFQKANKSLFSFQNGLKEIRGLVKTSLIGASVGLVGIDKLYSGISEKYSNLSNSFGDQFEGIQKYLNSANINVLTNADSVGSELMNLKNQLNDIRTFGAVPAEFNLLGIDVNQSDIKIIDSIANKLQNLNSTQANSISNKLGLSDFYKSLSTLKEGKALSDIFSISNSDIKSINQTRQSINQLKESFLLLKDKALVNLAPVLNTEILGFLKWVNLNQDSVIYLIKSTTEAFINLAKGAGDLIRFTSNIVGFFMQSENGVKNLTAGIALLLAVLFPQKALFTGIILALEDLYVYFKHGESVIGSFIDKFSFLSDILKKIREGFEAISNFNFKDKLFGVETNQKEKLIEQTVFKNIQGNEVNSNASIGEKLFGNQNDPFASIYDSFQNIKDNIYDKFANNKNDSNFFNQKTIGDVNINITTNTNSSPQDIGNKVRDIFKNEVLKVIM